jgi:hypothetical protein
MNKAPTSYQNIKPIHPTVAAEFDVRRSAIAGDDQSFVWVRGDVAGAGCATLGECEKAALAYLRSLPVRP